MRFVRVVIDAGCSLKVHSCRIAIAVFHLQDSQIIVRSRVSVVGVDRQFQALCCHNVISQALDFQIISFLKIHFIVKMMAKIVLTIAMCEMLYQTSAWASPVARLNALSKQETVKSNCCA